MDELLRLQREYDVAIKELDSCSILCAKWEASFKNLDALVKTTLANAYNKLIDSPGSQKDREMRALSSEEYGIHLSALSDSRGKFLKYRAMKEVCIAKCEYCRTMISSERAKIGIK